MKSKKLISFLCAAAMTVSSFAGLAVTTASAADDIYTFVDGSTAGWSIDNGGSVSTSDTTGDDTDPYLIIKGGGAGTRSANFTLPTATGSQYVVEFDSLIHGSDGMNNDSHYTQLAFGPAGMANPVESGYTVMMNAFRTNRTGVYVNGGETAYEIQDKWTRTRIEVDGTTAKITMIDKSGTIIDGETYTIDAANVGKISARVARGDGPTPGDGTDPGYVFLDNVHIYNGTADGALSTDGLRGEAAVATPYPEPEVKDAAPYLVAPEGVTKSVEQRFDAEFKQAMGAEEATYTDLTGLTIHFGGRSDNGADGDPATYAATSEYAEGDKTLELTGGRYSNQGRGPRVWATEKLGPSGDDSAVMAFAANLTSLVAGGAGRLYILGTDLQAGDTKDGEYNQIMAVLATDDYEYSEGDGNNLVIKVEPYTWYKVGVVVSGDYYRVFVAEADESWPTSAQVKRDHVGRGDSNVGTDRLTTPYLAVTSADSKGGSTNPVVRIDNLLTYTGSAEEPRYLLPSTEVPVVPTPGPSKGHTVEIAADGQTVTVKDAEDDTIDSAVLIHAQYANGVLSNAKTYPLSNIDATTGVTVTLTDTTQVGDKIMVWSGTDTIMPYGVKVLSKEDGAKDSYNVNIAASVGGSVTASKISAVEGEEITLTVKADSGYEFTSLTVDGAEVTVTDNKYTFTMPAHDVAVSAVFTATAVPTDGPVVEPTDGPVVTPTDGPVVTPTDAPTAAPTDGPVVTPTTPVVEPTDAPTEAPKATLPYELDLSGLTTGQVAGSAPDAASVPNYSVPNFGVAPADPYTHYTQTPALLGWGYKHWALVDNFAAGRQTSAAIDSALNRIQVNDVGNNGANGVVSFILGNAVEEVPTDKQIVYTFDAFVKSNDSQNRDDMFHYGLTKAADGTELDTVAEIDIVAPVAAEAKLAVVIKVDYKNKLYSIVATPGEGSAIEKTGSWTDDADAPTGIYVRSNGGGGARYGYGAIQDLVVTAEEVATIVDIADEVELALTNKTHEGDDVAEEVHVGDTLKATITIDEDSDLTEDDLVLAWYSGDQLVAAATYGEYTVAETDLGKTITAKVTYGGDGAYSGVISATTAVVEAILVPTVSAAIIDSAAEDYAVTGNGAGGTIKVVAKNLESIAGAGDAGEGYWVGPRIDAPKGTTITGFYFGTVAMGEEVEYNTAVENDGAWMAFYSNAGATAPKTFISIVLSDGREFSYTLDLSEVSLAGEISVSVGNMAEENWTTNEVKGKVTEDGVTKVTIEVTGVKSHKNANQQDGYWVGVMFGLTAQQLTDTTKHVYYGTTAKGDDWSATLAAELAEAGSEDTIGIYTNVGTVGTLEGEKKLYVEFESGQKFEVTFKFTIAAEDSSIEDATAEVDVDAFAGVDIQDVTATLEGKTITVEGTANYVDDADVTNLFPEDEKGGHYLVLGVKIPEEFDATKGTITVKGSKEKTFTGAEVVGDSDYKDGVWPIIMYLDKLTDNKFTITIDLDGAGLEYAPATYTVDVSGVYHAPEDPGRVEEIPEEEVADILGQFSEDVTSLEDLGILGFTVTEAENGVITYAVTGYLDKVADAEEQEGYYAVYSISFPSNFDVENGVVVLGDDEEVYDDLSGDHLVVVTKFADQADLDANSEKTYTLYNPATIAANHGTAVATYIVDFSGVAIFGDDATKLDSPYIVNENFDKALANVIGYDGTHVVYGKDLNVVEKAEGNNVLRLTNNNVKENNYAKDFVTFTGAIGNAETAVKVEYSAAMQDKSYGQDGTYSDTVYFDADGQEMFRIRRGLGKLFDAGGWEDRLIVTVGSEVYHVTSDVANINAIIGFNGTSGGTVAINGAAVPFTTGSSLGKIGIEVSGAGNQGRGIDIDDFKVSLVEATPATVTVKTVYEDENGEITITGKDDKKYTQFGETAVINSFVGVKYQPVYETVIDQPNGEPSAKFAYVEGGNAIASLEATNDVYLIYTKCDYKETTFTVTLTDAKSQLTDDITIPVVVKGTATNQESVTKTVDVKVSKDTLTASEAVKLLDGTYTYSIEGVQMYREKTGDVTLGDTNAIDIEIDKKTPATLTIKYVEKSGEEPIRTEVYQGESDLFIEDATQVDLTDTTYLANIAVKGEDNMYTVYTCGSVDPITVDDVEEEIEVTVTKDAQKYYYYQDYDRAEASDWNSSQPGRYTVSLKAGTGYDKYTSVDAVDNGNNGSLISNTNLAVPATNPAIIEFDAAITNGNNQPSYLMVGDASSETNYLFHLKATAASATTYKINEYADVTLNKDTFYHFKLERTAEGLNVTITPVAGGDAAYNGTITAENSEHMNLSIEAKGIYFETKRYYTGFKADNIKTYTPAA